LEGKLVWSQGTMYLMGGVDASMGTDNFGELSGPLKSIECLSCSVVLSKMDYFFSC